MAKKKIILCDTNILIHYLRNDKKTVLLLDKIGFENLAISVITSAEILFGAKKNELKNTKIILKKFNTIHIDVTVSKIFLENYFNINIQKIHIADALIAATALAYNLELFTLNKKDFIIFEKLKLYK